MQRRSTRVPACYLLVGLFDPSSDPGFGKKPGSSISEGSYSVTRLYCGGLATRWVVVWDRRPETVGSVMQGCCWKVGTLGPRSTVLMVWGKPLTKGSVLWLEHRGCQERVDTFDAVNSRSGCCGFNLIYMGQYLRIGRWEMGFFRTSTLTRKQELCLQRSWVFLDSSDVPKVAIRWGHNNNYSVARITLFYLRSRERGFTTEELIPIATPEPRGRRSISYALTQTLLGSADERRFQDSSFRTSQGQEEYDSLQKP
jgi:hypothetical protein